MEFLAAWAGRADISIVLVNPSDATLFLKNTLWYASERIFWTGIFSHKGLTQKTSCTLKSPGLWKNKCTFAHPAANGRTSLVCDKPKDLPCGSFTLIQYDKRKTNSRLKQIGKGKEYLFEG